MTAATLEEVLRAALTSEESTRIAGVEAGKAALRSKRGLLALTPDLRLKASWQKSEEETEGAAKQLGYQIALTQPLYTGGRAVSAYRGLRAAERAARLQEALVRRAVLLQAAVAYYGVLEAADAVGVAEQAVLAAEEQHRLAARRVELGEAVLVDALQAEVNLLRQRDGLAAARGALANAREAVRRLCGLELADAPAAPPPLADVEGTAEELVAEALARRLELEIERLTIAAAEQDLREKRGRFLPQLGLQANWGRAGEEIEDLAWSWSVGVSLELPIYQSGQRFLELKESTLSLEQARIGAGGTARDIERDVRNLRNDLRTAASRLASLAVQVAAAEESHRLATRRYELGLAGSLEVLDAQTALATARAGRVVASYGVEVLKLRLLEALGREPFPGLAAAPAGGG